MKVSVLQTPRFVGEGWGSGLWNTLFGGRAQRHSPSNDNSVNRRGKLLSFNRISETLGALNTVGRLIVNMTRGQEVSLMQQTDGKADNIPEAILTLTKNVLGQNVTKTIEPLIKRVGMTESPAENDPEIVASHVQVVHKVKDKIKKKRREELVDESESTTIPPFVELTNSSYLHSDISIEGKEGENRCRTPSGEIGRCEDLSNCPGLLLDLTHLRESLCFKSLFVPGVCCPLDDLSPQPITQKPLKLTTAASNRPSLILKPTSTSTTKRPLVPVFTLDSESQSSNVPHLGDNLVDAEECGEQEISGGMFN